VPDEKCFTGFEAYKQLLAVPEINYVLLATPPHFRPTQLMATIEAGKHAFIEKPVAVDGAGVKLVMEAGELARKKNLTIGSGTLRRKLPGYIETIKRIRDGAIGDMIYARAYWNGNPVWSVDREPGWSDMEWQLRNWAFFTWLGGDHIVEQHVHNLDIMNWALNAHPLKATALSGRQVRTDRIFGHIYDHFAVEYEYPNGVRMFSQTRQMPACENNIEENVLGTKGASDCKEWIRGQDQKEIYRYPGKDKLSDGFQLEQRAFIASIRAGKPINEAQSIAESTLTAIIGRDSAYSGRSVEWNEALNSPCRLGPEKYEMGPIAVPEVAMPGQYKL
jgi:predicted dehydrogenase